MSVGTTRQSKEDRPLEKVLVLGNPGMADLIAKQLKVEGFEPVLREPGGSSLPSLADPQAMSRVRQLLETFVFKHQEPGARLYVHPGVSIWAERPELPILGQELGLTVIAPTPRILGLFWNKLSLYSLAEKEGIPNLLLTRDLIHSVRELEELVEAEALHFPLSVRTAQGGGNFGFHLLHSVEEVESKFPLWQEHLHANLGEAIFLAERYAEAARKIMVSFARFADGTVETFPLVDVSLQSRFRKIAEVCPAPALDPEIEARLNEWTARLAESCGYVGVGFLEFLVEAPRIYLVGGAPRLNTTYGLWQKVAGTSAVAWQIATLNHWRPPEFPVREPKPQWNVGVALKILAEDPILQLPQPGVVRETDSRRLWDLQQAVAELDLFVTEGSRIDPDGYGVVGLLRAGGQSLKQAITVCCGVVRELWIAGSIQTNERFLSELVNHPWVREGMFHSDFVDEEFLPAIRPSGSMLQAFPTVLATALGDLSDSTRWVVGDQWARTDPKQIVWVGEGPELWKQDEMPGVSGMIRLPEGEVLRVCAFPTAPDKWLVRVGLWVLSVRRVPPASASRARKQPKISALVPGRVHFILYREGAVVPAHENILVMESLGTLVPHALPVEVRIVKWLVKAGDFVIAAGKELAELEVLSKN